MRSTRKRRPAVRSTKSRAGTLDALLSRADGKVLNASAIGRALRTTDGRVRRMLRILALAGVIRMVPAWQEKLAKRQVKAPMIWVRGRGWKEPLIAKIELALRAKPSELHFWSTYQGARIDLLFVRGKKRRGYVLGRAKNATLTKSARIAQTDLRLTSLDVVHFGPRTRPLAPKIRALAASRIAKDVRR